MASTRTTSRGFTLMELLVVLVVLVVISAIAVPRFGLANQRFGLEMATEQVTRDIAYAQDHARSMSTAFRLLIDGTNDTITVSGPVSSGSPTAVHVTEYAKSPFGVDIGPVTPTALTSTIVVNGFGDLQSPVVMRLQRGGMKADIVAMNPGGLVNISAITRTGP